MSARSAVLVSVLPRVHVWRAGGVSSVVGAVAAAGAVAFVPLWWHLKLVDPGIDGIIAVFAEVAVYPSDVCLLALAAIALLRPPALTNERRLLVAGLTLLTAATLLSAWEALDPVRVGGLAAHLALLSLAWLGVRSANVSRTVLAAALVASAVAQSVLAVAQFLAQQPLLAAELHVPWLPWDVSQAGAPVVLNAAGDRLLRGLGTFPHPNVLGGYLAVAVVTLPLLGERWPRFRRLWQICGGTIALGLLASLCRGGTLAGIIGLGVWWFTRRSNQRVGFWPRPRRGEGTWPALRAVAASGALAVTVVYLSPIAEPLGARLFPFGPSANALERGSVENRLALDRDAFLMVRDHLPLGVGGGNYGLAALAGGYQEGWGEPAPNLALLIAAELGLPGIVAAGLIVFATVRVLRGSGHLGRLRPHSRPRIDRAAAATLIALLVLSMLDHYLWTMPPGRVIAWLPFALLAATPAPQRLDRSD